MSELPLRLSVTGVERDGVMWPSYSYMTMSDTKSVAVLCSDLDTIMEGKARAPLLIELLGRGGHERHEDIVFELGLIGDPAAVNAVEKAAGDPFPYLEEWGNLRELQRKCAYALARIGTAESRAALERLAKHADPYLREYGQEGLEHWPLPFKAR
ncbi:HEAT repeat domain-containing protein (plasmid) [Ralstonia solanacearum P673]|uniref:HEAT repeat domain-containing protein n=1 Tax=Ralstonia solanacearum TaxID=305 RepID=UPI001267A03C|nr:HEAT repeat domain-containing protein [Ralstonia solanacearum]MCL9851719.1 HEAT repeat domain-containing protein [Ralstonia solanacearum]MCL9856861.1 HEAT repeat domain-containing protein [Ralstonia solanacearum]MCL9861664.1 HEAT repeat domain-containing protein [Ralstonia solanacearum]MCL9866495.1 HEAT repeat domain-containing protein [Ralstonia solanacearum]MCL9871244.1 HEAT repeat domain-containing protein [Ralstonia solanacearum]